MRKPKTYIARRGSLLVEAATRSDAKAMLDRQLDRACELPYPIVESRFGLVLILIADPTGWQSTIVDPAEFKHGDNRHCWSCFGPVTIAEATQSIRINAAQRAWTPAVDDSAHIAAAGLTTEGADSLRHWIKFQRDYLAGKNMTVDIVAADTGILERLSVPLSEALGNDSHEIARAAAELAANGRALIGGGAAPAFYLTAA